MSDPTIPRALFSSSAKKKRVRLPLTQSAVFHSSPLHFPFLSDHKALPTTFVLYCSGDGDVDTTKTCKADVKYFCSTIKPGEGRLATCLSNQIEEEEKGSVTGRKTTNDCREEVRQFKIDR